MSVVLGRFGFAAGAIDYFRTFLGPFYDRVSSSPLGAVREIPIMLMTLLYLLLKLLESGGFMMDCSRPIMEGTAPDSFRADAMAEKGRVAMEGWCCADSPDPFKCRWYFWSLRRRMLHRLAGTAMIICSASLHRWNSWLPWCVSTFWGS